MRHWPPGYWALADTEHGRIFLFWIIVIISNLSHVSVLQNRRWTKCERENKFKFIFTPVYWGEKIYLNLFSLPFNGERKYISIILPPVYWERKFRFIFSPQKTGKIDLNLFSLSHLVHRKNRSKAQRTYHTQGELSHQNPRSQVRNTLKRIVSA